MDCSLPGSSVHGILLARILEWVVYPFSRGSSQPRNRTRESWIAGGLFTSWAIKEVLHLYVNSKKKCTNVLIYKIEIESQTENKLMVARGKAGKGDEPGDWEWHIHSTVFKIGTSKDLLCSTGNSTQPIWEKNLKKSGDIHLYIYMYNWFTFCIAETNTIL